MCVCVFVCMLVCEIETAETRSVLLSLHKSSSSSETQRLPWRHPTQPTTSVESHLGPRSHNVIQEKLAQKSVQSVFSGMLIIALRVAFLFSPSQHKRQQMTRRASSGGKRRNGYDSAPVCVCRQQDCVIVLGCREDSSWLISLINYANCLPQSSSPPGNHAPFRAEPNCAQRSQALLEDHGTQHKP